MINSRVNRQGCRHVHLSADQGKTWTSHPDTTLPDPGCNAGLIRYSSLTDPSGKNILLFSHASSNNQRIKLSLRISYDEGKTWSPGKTLYPGSSAYSSLCLLKNGDIGLFFEKDDYTDNVFVRIQVGWLTDNG